MVKEDRLKSTSVSNTFTAATSGVTLFIDNPINGKIVQVDQSAFWQNGSLSLTVSGTNQELWHRNASSGTSISHYYPAHFTESTTGSIVNASHLPFYVNDVLKLSTGSTASGTSQTLGLTVKYI